jgi:hypothetical protein
LLGFVDKSGIFWAKQGMNSAFLNERTGVSQASVATDPTDGPLLGIDVGGIFYAKRGLNAEWNDEYPGVTQISIATG